MSAEGLIGRALLGATHGAATGIGERLRKDAKLKRDKALSDHQTKNTKSVDAHRSALNMGENTQKAEITRERDDRLNEQKRGNLKLTDDLRDNRHEDITGDGGNVIGYRDMETNKPTYFTDPDGGSGSSAYFGSGLSKEDWSRLKYVHGVKNDRLNELREMARDPTVEMNKSATEEMAALNTEVQQLEGMVFGRGGQSELQRLLSGDGGNAGQNPKGSPSSEPDKPGTVGGLVSQAMNQQKQSDGKAKRAENLASEAEYTAKMLDVRPRNNTGSRPYAASTDQPTEQAMKGARVFRDKISAMSTEEFEALFSPRQQSAILDTMRKIEETLSQ